MNEFQRCLAKLLRHEGGYVNHPNDPGGATNYGITQAVYDTWRRTMGLKLQSVKLITASERDSIYRGRYWALIKGDSLPAGVSYVVFDGAVNSGVAQSVKWLQRALGAVKVDGVIGQETLAAVRAINDHDALIQRIIDRRMAFLRQLKTWKTFRKGWTQRVNDVLAVGQAWAMGSVGPEIEFVSGGNIKARIEDAKAAPSTAPGDVIAGGGTVGTILTQATEQLTPLTSIEFVGKAVAVLTIAGVAITLGGVAWRWWAKRRRDQLADALDLRVVPT